MALAEGPDNSWLWRTLLPLRREDMRAKRLVTCARAAKNRRRKPELATSLARWDATPVLTNSAKRFAFP